MAVLTEKAFLGIRKRAKTEDRRWKTEDRRPKTEEERLKSDAEKGEFTSPLPSSRVESEYLIRHLAPSTQYPVPSTQYPVPYPYLQSPTRIKGAQ
jgi:hypothetical protein